MPNKSSPNTAAPCSILHILRQQSQQLPEQICLADEHLQISYSRYWQLIQFYAAELRQNGLQPGQCAIIHCSQDIPYLVAYHAVQLAGCIPVPVEKKCAAERVQQIAAAAGAKVNISADAVAGLQNLAYPVCSDDQPAQAVVNFPLPGGSQTSQILFTTGTTGSSKGIVLCHAADVAVAENVAQGVQMQAGNVEILPMPLNHSFALRRYFAVMLSGGCTVIMNGLLMIRRLFDNLQKFRANSIALAPAALTMILRLSGRKLAEFDNQLDFVQFGSAPLPEEDKKNLLQLLPSCRLYNIYGSTEAGCASVLNFNSADDQPHCIGWPTVNSRVKILDEAGAEISKPGEQGRLAWGGSMCMQGYFGEQPLPEQGWILTSDLGCYDEQGRLYMLGRADDVINWGGMKISPLEVEDVARLFPGISDCACAAFADDLGGDIVALFIEAEQNIDKKQLHAFLAGKLEPYKVPRKIEQLAKLPRTYNGKLDRKKLPQGKHI